MGPAVASRTRDLQGLCGLPEGVLTGVIHTASFSIVSFLNREDKRQNLRMKKLLSVKLRLTSGIKSGGSWREETE